MRKIKMTLLVSLCAAISLLCIQTEAKAEVPAQAPAVQAPAAQAPPGAQAPVKVFERDSGPKIIVLRHAEKPVNYTVNPNLTPAGYLRADEIPAFLLNRYGQPDFIFAAKSTKSNRPVETITPYSNATGVPIDTTFDDVDNAQIARQLLSEPKYNGKLIVICWRHESIPALAEALHAPATTFPSPWWDEVFNLVLQFDYTKGDPTPKVSSIYEPF